MNSNPNCPKARLPLRQLLLLPTPCFMSGFLLKDWIRLLIKHRFSIDCPFWMRAIMASLGAAITSLLAICEKYLESGPVDSNLLESPVFILGLPRSGTSHLYDLLAQCPQLCFPTRFDAFNPHSFLLLRRMGLFSALTTFPRFKRAMDNLRVGWDSPEEDIVAISILTSKGERIGGIFPKDSMVEEDTQIDGIGNKKETLKLVHALRSFTRKLVILHRRRVLLKSPRHMARVREILQVFPHAKFVTIFRNPINQFASLRAMHDSGNPYWSALQWPLVCPTEIDLKYSGRLLRHYFEARKSIPKGNLIEITFEELIEDRVAVVSRICQELLIESPKNPVALASTAGQARPPRAISDSWKNSLREHYKPLCDAGFYQELLSL